MKTKQKKYFVGNDNSWSEEWSMQESLEDALEYAKKVFDNEDLVIYEAIPIKRVVNAPSVEDYTE